MDAIGLVLLVSPPSSRAPLSPFAGARFLAERRRTRMRLRSVLRVVVVAGVLGLLVIVLAPAAPSLTPYASALSEFAAGNAFAAPPPPCDNKVCDFSDPSIPIC